MYCSYLWKRDARNLRDKSYMAKFRCEVVRCAKETGNCKAAAIFGVDESNF
jgi:hypothetical protein